MKRKEKKRKTMFAFCSLAWRGNPSIIFIIVSIYDLKKRYMLISLNDLARRSWHGSRKSRRKRHHQFAYRMYSFINGKYIMYSL